MENFFWPIIGIAIALLVAGLLAFFFERRARNKAIAAARKGVQGGGGPGAGHAKF